MASTSPLSRRSVSLPTRTVTVPDPQVEVLYYLPSVRIVAFTTPSLVYQASSSHGGSTIEQTIGTLPWTSATERTLAVGPLRLYRAPGSVAFVNCANALQPILPKSQCWCVSTDGDRSCKIILQIRRPSFWRIEVPNQAADERTRVEEFKATISKVLLFEKTPCPFQRTFSVDLPEAPQTPVRKRPWRPVDRQSIGRFPSPDSNLPEDPYRPTTRKTSLLEHSATRAVIDDNPPKGLESPLVQTKTNLTTPFWPASLTEMNLDPFMRKSSYVQNVSDSRQAGSPEGDAMDVTGLSSMLECEIGVGVQESDNFNVTMDDTDVTPKSHFQPSYQPLIQDLHPEYKSITIHNCSRSVAAPPLLTLVTSPPSKHRTESPSALERCATNESDSDHSIDSFHSVSSWHSPLDPPSPKYANQLSPKTYPYPHDNIALPDKPHPKDESELTAVPQSPKTPGVWQAFDTETPRPRTPNTPNLVRDTSDDEHDRPEAITPPTVRQSFRHRATTSSNSRRRALSPLPAAANLFAPPKHCPRRLQTARHLPTAIIQTTCKILLSPPSHLLNLMLSIASKIAAGEWSGFLTNQGENVYWDFEQEYGAESWSEDDYGISLPPKTPFFKGVTHPSSQGSGESWEVD